MASQDQPVIAFIGAGNMAEAILGGLYAKRDPSQLGRLRFSEPVKERCEYMCNKFPKAVSYGSDNNACINGADVVVLAVKPQVMRKVVQELQVQDPNILVISIAAGIRTFDIQRWINSKDTSTAVVRCMPNTPALIGEGAAGLYATDAVSDAQRATAEAILKSIGKQVVWVEEEKHIDTVTGLSGSGPAYFFLFMEAMKAAGVESGLSPEVAEALVMQTCVGAGRMAQLSDDDLATLRQKVTSPNGTTEAALKTMEAGNIRKIIRDGVLAAENRGHELANEMGADD